MNLIPKMQKCFAEQIVDTSPQICNFETNRFHHSSLDNNFHQYTAESIANGEIVDVYTTRKDQ